MFRESLVPGLTYFTSLATGGALSLVLPQEMAEVSQFSQPSRPMHFWPDEALALGVIGRSIVAVVVECLVTPARLPIVHVGSGSGNNPPSVGGVLRRGGVDVFSR